MINYERNACIVVSKAKREVSYEIFLIGSLSGQNVLMVSPHFKTFNETVSRIAVFDANFWPIVSAQLLLTLLPTFFLE